jgi:hypothetical protein
MILVKPQERHGAEQMEMKLLDTVIHFQLNACGREQSNHGFPISIRKSLLDLGIFSDNRCKGLHLAFLLTYLFQKMAIGLKESFLFFLFDQPLLGCEADISENCASGKSKKEEGEEKLPL